MFPECGELGVLVKDKVYGDWTFLGLRDHATLVPYILKTKLSNCKVLCIHKSSVARMGENGLEDKSTGCRKASKEFTT